MNREDCVSILGRKAAICLLAVLAFILAVCVLLASSSVTKSLDVPYVHQTYDTADDFNGSWACGPACGVMILAYYDRISPDPMHVSYPAPGHQSDYGVYVSRKYIYVKYTFLHASTLETGSGVIVGKGAWGYIWKGGIDYVLDNLLDYLECHDLVAAFKHYDERSARQLVQEEIGLGRPLIARNLLDPSGHYVVVVGYKIDEHGDFWYLVNDPLGKTPYESWGEYGVDQPVSYSYSQLGLGEYRSRGLITIRPKTISTTVDAASEGKIAFCSSLDGNWEIYVMDADGSNQTRLTNNPAYDMDPSWSPNGERIAFWSHRDGNWEIYVMNADGSGQTRLTYNLASDTYPDWSPDGKRIAFHSNRDGNWEIYVMDADGSSQTRLTNNPGNDWEPAWSPDGKRIAFHFCGTGQSNGDIYVMDADGSNRTRLTATPADEQDPAWSPDGTKIAFESDAGGDYEIYVMKADGSNQIRLTRNSTMDSTPSWSPDGTELVFARGSCWTIDLEECPGKSEIYIMDADGGNEQRITNNLFEDDMPDWLME